MECSHVVSAFDLFFPSGGSLCDCILRYGKGDVAGLGWICNICLVFAIDIEIGMGWVGGLGGCCRVPYAFSERK